MFNIKEEVDHLAGLVVYSNDSEKVEDLENFGNLLRGSHFATGMNIVENEAGIIDVHQLLEVG